MKSKGFTLIWVLILLVILAGVASAMLQSANASDRSSRAVARGTLLRIQERNRLTYAQRLLEAQASTLLRSLPTPTATNATQIADQLQAQVNEWCTKDPDGHGGSLRVYFTSAACDQGLPSGVTAPTIRVTQNAGLWTLEAGFVLVGPGAAPAVKRGQLTANYGQVPADTYALLVPGDATLSNLISTEGDAHVDGRLTLSGTVTVDGTLSVSGCSVVTAGCAGTPTVNLGDAATSAMAVTPTPAHPAQLTGTLTLGQSGETADMTAPTLSGLTVTATSIDLGVIGSGEQYIRTCLYFICTQYVATADGHLRKDGVLNDPIITSWNGAIGVTSPSGDVVIRPINADAPSVARSLSLIVTGGARVDGNVTYTQTNCTALICNPDSSSDALSIQATRVTVTTRTVRLHAAVLTDQFIVTAPLTLFGSLIGSPRLVTSPVYIQADPRAAFGVAPAGVPRLAARWRKATVTVAP